MRRLSMAAADLAELRRVVAEHAPEAEVWIYGSRVSGGSHEGSDIDLVLRNPGDLETAQADLAALQAALSESRVAVLVDVLDWAQLPESFRHGIERQHEVLQPGRPGHASPAADSR